MGQSISLSVRYWLYINVFILCSCVPAISSSMDTFKNTVTESSIISTSSAKPSAFTHNVITSSLDDALPFTISGTFTSTSSNKQRESVFPSTSGNTPVSVSPSTSNVTPGKFSSSTEEPKTGTKKIR